MSRPMPPPRNGISPQNSSGALNSARRPVPPPRPDKTSPSNSRLDRSHSATERPSDFNLDEKMVDNRPAPPPRPPRATAQDGRRATVSAFFIDTLPKPSSLPLDITSNTSNGNSGDSNDSNSPRQPSLSSLDAYLNKKTEKRLISRNSILDVRYVYDQSRYEATGVFSAPSSPPGSPTLTSPIASPPQSPRRMTDAPAPLSRTLSQSTPSTSKFARKYDYQRYDEDLQSNSSEEELNSLKESSSIPPAVRRLRDEIPRPLSLMKAQRQQHSSPVLSLNTVLHSETTNDAPSTRRGTKIGDPSELFSLDRLGVSPRAPRRLERTLSKQLQKRKTMIALPIYADKSKVELDLTDRKLDRLAAVELAVALREFTRLKTLKLFANGVGNEGAGGFADLLFYNSSLANLKLKYKEPERNIGSLSAAPDEECIGDEGAEYIAEALETNQTLVRLDVSNNYIDTSGLRALASALTINNGLRYLDISGNSFSSETDAMLLAKALRNNHSLTMLKLKNSHFNLEGLSTLLKCLKRNRTLLEIDLTCKKHNIPKLTPRHIDLFVSYLERNRTLTALRWRDKNQLHIPEPLQRVLHQNVWFLKERVAWKKDHTALFSDKELDIVMKRHGTQFICSDIGLKEANLVQLLNWQNVRELYLAHNELTTIPSEIMLLKQLKYFVLTGNKISTLPSSVGELVALRMIDLSHNALVELPSSLQSLRNMRRLFLSHNQLPTVPGGLIKLSLLQHLDLSFNKITVLPSDFGKLKHLENLWLQNNSITMLPKSISDISDLRSLKVQNNNLRELPPDLIELKRLETLNVRDNPLPKDISEGNLQAVFSFLKTERKAST